MSQLLPRWCQLTKQCLQTDVAKYSVSIGLGIVFGIILNVSSAGHNFTTLITLPGQLFLRALQCAVVPMMFFNITSSIAQIYGEGRVGSLGSKIFKFYMITTLLAVFNGIAISNVYSSLFSSKNEDDDDDGAEVEFICPKSFGKLTVDSTGNVICLPLSDVASYNVTAGYQVFELQDNEDVLVNYAIVKRSLTDQILSLFDSLVPNNFAQSFATPNIISVIVIAFVLGIAIVYESDSQEQEQEHEQGSNIPIQHSTSSPLQGTRIEETNLTSGYQNSSSLSTSSDLKVTPTPAPNRILELFKDFASISNRVILWIVYLAPWCIAFLIAGSISQAGQIDVVIKGVGVYVLATLTGIILHLSISLPAVFFFYTGENPYQWMYTCRKAMLIAFSTSSSAATLPITIQTVVETGLVSESIANIVLPIGANVNMDGTAVGFPCAINFLAHSHNYHMNALSWLNVAIGSTLGSIGAAPVPSAGLVILITVWETVFPGKEIPAAVAYVQAIDFLLDRFETMTNVASDIMTIRMLQVHLDLEAAKLKSSGSVGGRGDVELA